MRRRPPPSSSWRRSPNALGELAPEVSDEARAAALDDLRDKFAVIAERWERLPTFREIEEALEGSAGSKGWANWPSVTASERAIAAAEAMRINPQLSNRESARLFGISEGYVRLAADLLADDRQRA
jgi:hypothetical protein